MNYKGYAGSVDYSEEDNCLYGKVLGMSKDNITYEGKDVDELRKDFEGAVDDYLVVRQAVSSHTKHTAAILTSGFHPKSTAALQCWHNKQVRLSMVIFVKLLQRRLVLHCNSFTRRPLRTS